MQTEMMPPKYQQPRPADGRYATKHPEAAAAMAKIALRAGAIIRHEQQGDLHIVRWWR